MKRLSLIAATLVLSGAAPLPPVDSSATFDWFSYQGRDGAPTVSAGYYRNPVLSGFYSDPSIVRVGDMFYLTTSTFSWFPGIPVFASPDLVHWRQIGNGSCFGAGARTYARGNHPACLRAEKRM